MRTVTSALFIALCILFAASYTTALRQRVKPGFKSFKKIGRPVSRRVFTPSSDWSIKPAPGVWYPPRPRFEMLPKMLRGDVEPQSDLYYETAPIWINRPPIRVPLADSDRLWEPPVLINRPERPWIMADKLWDERPIYTTFPVKPKNYLYSDDLLEEYDEEDWGVNGNIGNNGQWNLGGSYSNNGLTGTANIGNNGQWNVGGSYTNGGFTGGVNAGNNGQWSANAGYNTQVGGGNLNIGGQVSNGGNWGVGATYTIPLW